MKNKIIEIYICLMLIITIIPISQADTGDSSICIANDDTWNKTYGGLKFDAGSSVQQTSDGGYIVVGETSKSILKFENSDVWLIKTDDKGNILWDQNFGGSEEDSGSFVMQTNDGGYIITGKTRSYSNGKTDVWLIKTDENGNKIWDKTFGYSDFDSGSEVKQTSDGGYIVVGNVNTSGGGLGDVWIIKVDSDGNKLWDKSFGGKGHNYGDSIQQALDGGYIILGSSWMPDETNSYDIWLIKIDSDGEMLWDKKYHGTDSDHGWSLQQTSDGGFIVVGMTKSGAGSDDVWLFKTDDTGVMLWDKIFGGTGQNRGYSVKQTNDGGFIIAGDTYKNLRMKASLIKTDSNGNEEWNKIYGGLGNDIFLSVQQTTDGGYILTGYEATLGNCDLWLVKTDSEGNAPKKFIRNFISESGKQNVINNNEGKALFASMYLELDPESQQVQDILDNYYAIPQGFLTNITITIPDPNDEDGEWFMIAPFFRTLIGQWIGIGPFFDIISPTETTIVHIPILWGDVHYWPPGSETPEEFIIDGWSPLISWEY